MHIHGVSLEKYFNEIEAGHVVQTKNNKRNNAVSVNLLTFAISLKISLKQQHLLKYWRSEIRLRYPQIVSEIVIDF